MKKIGISIQNGLLAEGIIRMLHENGEFQPFRITSPKKNGVVSNCLLQGADILLAEVSYANGATIEGRLSEAKALRAEKPECKIAFLCDENSSPEIAKAVMTATTQRDLPIYCVQKDSKVCSLTFDAAWGNAKVRQALILKGFGASSFLSL